MTSLSLPSCFFPLNFSSLRAACYPGVSLSVACVASVSLRFRSKERGVEERERRVQIVGTGACFKNRTCFLLFVLYFFCLLLSLFCVLLCLFPLYKIELECKQIVLFPSRQSPLSTHPYNVGSFSHGTSCDSVWPMKSSLHAPNSAKVAEAEALQRICPISWGIFKLLAVFISLAVMGWFNLLNKRFLMASCAEIKAKMASTWLHPLCRILEF